jgi:CheY-like chemotaxis protein
MISGFAPDCVAPSLMPSCPRRQFFHLIMKPNGLFRKRILLVGDNPGLREAIRLLLCLEGHTVTEVENGRRACYLFTPGDFDLVITDYAMPEMMGDELARTIKCLVPSQPILMIASGERISSSDVPFDALLQHPFKMAELRQLVASLLSSEPPSASLARACGAGLRTPVE